MASNSDSFLDRARSSIAHRISKTLAVPYQSALDGVDFGKKGCDLTVALPRFRLKEKPPILSQKLVAEVRGLNSVLFVDRA